MNEACVKYGLANRAEAPLHGIAAYSKLKHCLIAGGVSVVGASGALTAMERFFFYMALGTLPFEFITWESLDLL